MNTKVTKVTAWTSKTTENNVDFSETDNEFDKCDMPILNSDTDTNE